MQNQIYHMHNHCLSICFILIFLLSCNDLKSDSNEPQSLFLWPDSSQSEEAIERRLPSQGDDIIRITDVKQPSMDIYFADGNNSNPAILVFPGGGYGILAYDLEGTEVAEWLNSLGITAMVVKYTVPNDRESAFYDGQRAVRVVRKNATQWNIDPSKIGVLGFSAGAHLAARVSTNFNQLSYSKIDSVDELSTRPDFSIYVYPAYLNKGGTDQLAPEIKLTQEIPPAFIIQTKDDSSFVDGTKVFSKSLDSVGIDQRFHLLEKGGHGYGLRADTSLIISEWPELVENWLIEQQILN